MEIKVQDEVTENATEFMYLGRLVTWNNDSTREIERRIAKAQGVMAGLNTNKQTGHKTNLNVLKACVFSAALYV